MAVAAGLVGVDPERACMPGGAVRTMDHFWYICLLIKIWLRQKVFLLLWIYFYFYVNFKN